MGFEWESGSPGEWLDRDGGGNTHAQPGRARESFVVYRNPFANARRYG